MALCELSEQPGNLCDQIFAQESQRGLRECNLRETTLILGMARLRRGNATLHCRGECAATCIYSIPAATATCAGKLR